MSEFEAKLKVGRLNEASVTGADLDAVTYMGTHYLMQYVEDFKYSDAKTMTLTITRKG